MRYSFGFLNNDLTFMPYSLASSKCIDSQMFVSWYEFDETVLSLKDELKRAIHSLPKNCILLSGRTVMDDVITRFATSLRADISVKTFTPGKYQSIRLYRWIKKHRYKYFLTSAEQAYVLMEAEKLLIDNHNVALIGPLPIIKDNFWMLSDPPGTYSFVEETPHWVVADCVKNTSPFLMAKKYPNLIPNIMFQGNIFLAYLKDLDLQKQAHFYRRAGIREFLRGEVFARMVLPTDFAENKEVASISLKSAPLIDRRWCTFRSPVTRYYEHLNQITEKTHD